MRAHVRKAMDEGRDGAHLGADLHARRVREDRRAGRAGEGRVGVRRHASRTCAARATGCSRRSTRLLTIAREAHIRAEIYHLQGRRQGELERSWPTPSRRSRRRRKQGLEITADMLPTPRGPRASTRRCRRGCRRAATRSGRSGCRIRRSARACGSEMTHADRRVGEPDARRRRRRDAARRLQERSAAARYAGKTLAEVAKLRGTSIQDTAMDLVVEDGSRVQVVYFLDVRGQRQAADRACRG